ncbi:hypothetical protein KCU67_g10987, partial [Aureobasidium melanogenum]
RKTGKVCVATTFRLLYGEELEKAKKQSATAAVQTGETEDDTAQHVNTTEDQPKEQPPPPPPQNGHPENSNGDRELLAPLKGPELEKVDKEKLVQQPLQGPEESDALYSGTSRSLSGSGSRASLQDDDGEHPAGNAADQVIAASEDRRKSESA